MCAQRGGRTDLRGASEYCMVLNADGAVSATMIRRMLVGNPTATVRHRRSMQRRGFCNTPDVRQEIVSLVFSLEEGWRSTHRNDTIFSRDFRIARKQNFGIRMSHCILILKFFVCNRRLPVLFFFQVRIAKTKQAGSECNEMFLL